MRTGAPMTRKVLLILAATALPSLLLMTVGSGVAQAARTNPVVEPGSVTCANNWTGAITFTPHLKTGGTSLSEVFTIKAKLGNTANPCATTAGTVELGTIRGKLKFVVPAPGGANNCAIVFGGGSRAPVPASKLKFTWLSPGAPSVWKQPPPFSVVGTLGSPSTLAISGGKVVGSFASPPPPPPSASLSGPLSAWASAAITGACGTAAGLASLPLSAPSTGTW
jgi:hypothetical protein